MTLEPQFFDIFGAVGFVYIIIFSLLGLFGKNLPRWSFALVLFIGLVGAIIDSLIVYTFFLK